MLESQQSEVVQVERVGTADVEDEVRLDSCGCL